MMADDDGEMVTLEDILPDVEDTDDGGAVVRLEDDTPRAEGDFYRNLAEDDTIPRHELKAIATRLIENIGYDKDARSQRDELYAEGLRRTGLGSEAPGGAKFEGASKVVHPMLVEAAIDFAARAMKELWPAASGPVKTKIEGKETKDKSEKADRKARLMNWQMTVQAQEFRAEVEQMLTQVPMGGAQYLKLDWNHGRNRPEACAVFIDDMLIPFAATNFYTAERKTHVQYLTKETYEYRVKTGMYRDVDLLPSALSPEPTAAGKASDKIEGKEENAFNRDGLRTVFETEVSMVLPGDVDGEDPKPYLITTDKTTNEVLSIYRNWDEQDATAESLEWAVEFPFVPWRGAYPIGLPHIIGTLSGAATGALRALLDAAHIQNTPSGLKLKSAQVSGQNRSPQVGEILEIDGGIAVDDIRKLFMPMPYNQPSPVLFELLGFLVDAGKNVVRTTLEDVADTNPDVPVGTTLARMEQGMVVYSAIHARLHDSMGRVLRILHRFNAMYLKDEEVEADVGEDMATRRDFQGPMDVVPVSDPNIFSETQRYAQSQAVVQRAAVVPQLYNLRNVEERFLETLKVPGIDELLAPPIEPEAQNPIAENVALSLGRPVVAFPEQDHVAHLNAHLAFAMNPALGQNPLIAPKFIPGVIGHLTEHLVLWYMAAAMDMVEQETGIDIDKALEQHQGDEDFQAFDRMLAEAGVTVGDNAEQTIGQMMPIIQQLMQLAQQVAQPPPMDPMTAQTQIAASQVEVAKANVQKAQTDAQKAQIELQGKQMEQQGKGQELEAKAQEGQQKAMEGQAKLEVEGAKLQQKDQEGQRRDMLTQAQLQQKAEADARKDALARTKIEADREKADLDREAKLSMNEADNMTAMMLAEAEIEHAEKVAVSTGTGINPKAKPKGKAD